MGRRIFAVGNSALVARLSGVRTSIPILFAYMLSGHYLGILGGAILFTALGIMLSGTVLPEAVRNIIYGVMVLGAIIALRERRSA